MFSPNNVLSNFVGLFVVLIHGLNTNTSKIGFNPILFAFSHVLFEVKSIIFMFVFALFVQLNREKFICLTKFLNQMQRKKKCTMRLQNPSLPMYWPATMEPFSPMARRLLVKHTQWKVSWVRVNKSII